MFKHPTPQRADITLRANGQHVTLCAEQDLKQQGITNRRLSYMTTHAANLLFVNIRTCGYEMRVEASQLVLRFFKPKTDSEREAVKEAEALAMKASSQRDEIRARVLRMQADEILWTCVSQAASQ